MRERGPGRLRTVLFRATLLGYPRAFRRTWADELVRTFEDAWREEARSVAGACALWVRLARDGAINGLRLRLAPPPVGGGERRRESVMASTFRGLVQDGRLAVRGLSRQRSSGLAVVLTLALGIGAATAIFTVVDALLLRPLPFAQPERLVELTRKLGFGGIVDFYPASLAAGLLAEPEVFESAAAHARISGVLTGAGEPRELRVHAATGTFFEVLGRAPALGRAFTPAEAAEGARVMVIAHELWSHLGRDRDVIGQLLEFDGDRYEVIGVMPADFRFPTVFAAHAFAPMTADLRAAGLEQTRIKLVARLPAGMDTTVAAERVRAAVRGLQGDEAAERATWTAGVTTIGAWRLTPDAKRALWMVAGAVTLMLLIAIMNAANLLLTRVSGRSHEFGVRHALGASTLRLLRQLVTESLLLALIAGVAAVGMAYAGVQLLMRFAPPELTDLAANRVVLDGRVLVFAFAITVVTGLVLGVLPSLAASHAARRRIGLALSVYSGVTRERHRARSGLVVAQVAVAVTLLAGAGLLATSFLRIMRVDAGMDVDRTVLLQIFPNQRAYPNLDAVRALAGSLEERIAALPGVESVARADGLPPSANLAAGLALQAEEDAGPREGPRMLPFAYVRPDFLPTLGTRLVEGRNFTADETPETPVAIIDRDFARFFWGERAAVGRRFRIEADAPWLTVVGVVDELIMGGPDDSMGEYALLRPAAPNLASTVFAIRTRGAADRLIAPVRAAVRDVDPNQPVWKLATGRAALVDEVSAQRFFMLLMVALGTVSLALSALGLYSLLAFTVSRRVRELGIRMALGARSGRLVGAIVIQGVSLTVLGVAAGLAGALSGARLIESLLFEVSPRDPTALGAIAALMIVIAVLASAIPAIRAARVDPMRVLRTD